MSKPSDKTSCPRCGAGIALPETGLSMTCTYCGHEMAVPDLAARRAAMEREAAHRRALEQQQQKEKQRREREAQEEQKRLAREKRQQRSQRFASIRGCLVSIPIFAICLIGPGIGLYQSGVYEGVIGDPGAAAHARLAASAATGGYQPATNPQVVRVFSTSSEQVLELRDDLCYAFTAASGELIASLALTDPTGATVASSKELAFSQILAWCPTRSGAHKLRLTLDGLAGRVTWCWYWMARPSAPTVAAPAAAPAATTTTAAPKSTSRGTGPAQGAGATKGTSRGSRPQKQRPR